MTRDARKIRLVMELRQQGITDQRVLAAIERVPREVFVPESFQDQAYENTALPIGHGQTISQPAVVGFMTQALEIGPRMKVLEIGTGSGYQAAVLSHLCRRVCTMERHRPLLRQAEARFEKLGLNNITTRLGDGINGWSELAPFERIIVTAATPHIPPALVDQLADGGIMIAPIGPLESQHLCRFERHGAEVASHRLLPVRFVPLVGGVARERG